MLDRLRDFIKGVVNRMFSRETIENSLGVKIATSAAMSRNINLWAELYENSPGWCNENVKTMGLAPAIAAEISRLVTLELKTEITTDDFLNTEYQTVIDHIKEYTEYACAKGGLVFKPYLSSDNKHIEVDLVQANNFFPTAFNSRGEVTGAVFVEEMQKSKDRYYRLEYHDLRQEGYYISNTAFLKKNAVDIVGSYDLGRKIALTDVEEWQNLEPEILIPGIDKALFSYFKMPMANNVESSSPLGVSVFSRAVDKIKEADKQYSRILWEYEGSELAINASVDCFKQDEAGNPVLPRGRERLYRVAEYGIGEFNKAMEVFSPAIRDTSLFNGLNNILRQIEFMCGLAYGTLSDVNYTDKTAEEIKSSKQRSYDTVSAIQGNLKIALKQLVYAMNIWSRIAHMSLKQIDVDNDMSFDFDDSLIRDKDKDDNDMRADVAAGIIKPEFYIMKKYGVTKEEALNMIPDQEDNTDNNPDDLEE